MRFSAENYLKAFPRETNKPMKVEVVNQGNVIEEAGPVKQDPAAPGTVTEDAPAAADQADEPAAQEGADSGN